MLRPQGEPARPLRVSRQPRDWRGRGASRGAEEPVRCGESVRREGFPPEPLRSWGLPKWSKWHQATVLAQR